MIELDGVTIRYGNVVAVDSLTLSVPRGTIMGMLGGNGAGKSSTLRAVAGVNAHTSGRLVVSGHDMSTPAGAEAGRDVIGYCPDIGGLMTQATPREHVGVVLSLRGRLDLWPHALNLVERFGLSHVLDRPAGTFSHGMARRLSVLVAVLSATDALILDEPFDGVDPTGVDTTMDAIREAADAGLSVMVSTHLLPLLVEATDQIAVMVKGELVSLSPSEKFSGDEGARRYRDLLAGRAAA